jgi:succinyl-CoA synthetase beta subunit
MIAGGVVAAAKSLQVNVPIVVRLQGTNVDEGKRILAESGLALQPADTMADAAAAVVAAVKGAIGGPPPRGEGSGRRHGDLG